MQKQKLISLQTQDQQLGYDILGRLFSAAENYYLKCQGLPYNYQTTYYSSYDTFQNANKKSKEAVRRELINQINIFQASNKYFTGKYHFGLIPKDFEQSINDILKWKNSMNNPKDIELYNGILKILNNNQIDTDSFSNEKKEEIKKGGRQEFWSSLGPNAAAATDQRIEEINNNPNYKPTFHRGAGNNPYSNTNLSKADEIIKLQEEANKIILDLDNLFVKYYEGADVIKIIGADYQKLSKLIKAIDDRKSTYLFPESIIKKENFLNNINVLLSGEKNPNNKAIFIKLNQLFNDLL